MTIERGPTSRENTITQLIFNLAGLDQDEEFCGHYFETLKGRVRLVLDTYDSIDRTILQALKDKGFGPMTTETKELRFPVSPAELIEAVSNTVGGPFGTGQFSADAVIQIVKDLLTEPVPGPDKPKIREVTVVNGPAHGEKLRTVQENGITLNVPDVSQPLRRLPNDADIRYAHPTYMNQYFLLGDFAYYIGQRIMTTGGPFGMPHLDVENV